MVWDRIAVDEELVVMRKGKPIAVMMATRLCEIEDKLQARHAARFERLLAEQRLSRWH